MPTADWLTYDYYGFALIAIFGTLVAVLMIQWFIQYSRWAAWAQSLEGVAPPFINIIGVLFGLMLAFIANDTWSAHDRAMNAVYREADALRSIAAQPSPCPMRCARGCAARLPATRTPAPRNGRSWHNVARTPR